MTGAVDNAIRVKLSRKNIGKIQTGVYRHYKGQDYEVIGVAKHSETLEDVVVYKALYETEFGLESLWVRPLAMFTGSVHIDGRDVPRFSLIQNQ